MHFVFGEGWIMKERKIGVGEIYRVYSPHDKLHIEDTQESLQSTDIRPHSMTLT